MHAAGDMAETSAVATTIIPHSSLESARRSLGEAKDVKHVAGPKSDSCFGSCTCADQKRAAAFVENGISQRRDNPVSLH